MNTNSEHLDPLIVKKQSRRPRKSRMRGLEEGIKQADARSRCHFMRRSNCMQAGCNYKTCKKPRRSDLKIQKSKKRKDKDVDVSNS